MGGSDEIRESEAAIREEQTAESQKEVNEVFEAMADITGLNASTLRQFPSMEALEEYMLEAVEGPDDERQRRVRRALSLVGP
jgi:hypothetical protein